MLDKRHLMSRSHFLSHSVSGLGGVALAQLLNSENVLGSEKVRESAPGKTPIRPIIEPGNPNAARDSHFAPRATQVLQIFCSGAISQVDTFDYKPELIKNHGKPMPGGDQLITFQGE